MIGQLSSSRVLPAVFLLAGLLAGCGGGEQRPTQPDEPSAEVATVEVRPASVTLEALGQKQDFEATARDASGNAISGVDISWSISPDSVATVSSNGRATSEANGTATIEATASGVTGSAELTVDQRTAQISVTPDSATFASAGESRDFDAEARDENGHPVAGVEVGWSSTAPAVVAVDDTGGAVAQAAGGAAVRASVNRVRGYSRVTVEGDGDELDWIQVTAGLINGCGVTADLQLYCWGNNAHFQLGTATETIANSRPHEIEADEVLDRVYSGGAHICALAPDGAAYCWGESGSGEGGDGIRQSTDSIPSEVSGGHTFAQLTTAGEWTCGVTTAGTAYCWGRNKNGYLGDGTTQERTEPVAVKGNLTFEQIQAALGRHTCGVSSDGDVYCWGGNRHGQLGDGTTTERHSPVKVEADVTFEQVAVGSRHSCGLAKSGSTYCWGNNSSGRLGDGTTEDHSTPVQVETDRSFTEITTGKIHNCGLTSAGTAYCWGGNTQGQLGDGTNEARLVPTEVSGGHSFTDISAGADFTCAVAQDGTAYCWGDNTDLRLGIGSSENTNEPTPVAAPAGNG